MAALITTSISTHPFSRVMKVLEISEKQIFTNILENTILVTQLH